MTTLEDTDTQQPESGAQENPNYVLDPSRVRQLDRSLAAMLVSRRCPSCQTKLKSSRKLPSEEEHLKQITKCCATKEGFIKPEMPMQELVFRTLLSGGNKPISLERLHYAVTETWYTPLNPRSTSVNGLKLVLDNDDHYGFVEVA